MPNMSEIEILENEEFWVQKAIDRPEEVYAELLALREQKTASTFEIASHFVQDVEDSKESDE